MRGNGSTNRPKRPQIRQRSDGPDFVSGQRPGKSAPLPDSGGVPSKTGASFCPHSNDAGEAIEREP
jgi:hypothetical protein